MARYIPEHYGHPFKVNQDENGYYCENEKRRYDTLSEALSNYEYNSYFFKDKKRNAWRHRTPLKCFLNPILRKLQFWTDEPYVISSVVNFKNDIPYFEKYTLARVKYERK